MTDDITIRRAETPADYRACQRAQRLAWDLADEAYVVPVATLVGAQHHGGLVLGAFLPDGEAVGVSFGFLGRTGVRPCLYSQLTGVIPGRQRQGIGRRLKDAQREHCRAEGVSVLAWAFDPFRAGNARFNLAILGATAGRYLRDMYGPRTDALNAGTPTDRLIAEWEVDAEPRLVPPDTEWRAIPRILVSVDAGSPRISVPDSPRTLLEMTPGSAGRPEPDGTSRAMVAEGFLQAFACGYRAVGFVRDVGEAPAGRSDFYLLERGASETASMR